MVTCRPPLHTLRVANDITTPMPRGCRTAQINSQDQGGPTGCKSGTNKAMSPGEGTLFRLSFHVGSIRSSGHLAGVVPVCVLGSRLVTGLAHLTRHVR
jgi:hypothetical protein